MFKKSAFAFIVLVFIWNCITPCIAPEKNREKIPVPDKEIDDKNHTVLILHLDETGNIINDYSGKGNDGIALGTSSNNGVFNKAHEFDGNDWIILRNKNFSLSNNISLNVFVKIKNYPEEKYTIFSSTYESSNKSYFLIWLGINETKVEFIVSNESLCQYMLISKYNLPLNRWVNIQAIYNGDENFMGIYIDGVLSDGGFIPAPINVSNENITLNNENCNTSYFFSQNDFCIASLSNSTITIGAVYTNETTYYLDGYLDELVVFNTDVFYLNNTGSLNISMTTNNWWTFYNTTENAKNITIALAIIGILLFCITIGFFYINPITVRTIGIASLLSFFASILLVVCLVMIFNPIAVSWSLIFFTAGFFLLIMYILIKKNTIDIYHPAIEESLQIILPFIMISMFLIGAIDLYTGCFSLQYKPFWVI